MQKEPKFKVGDRVVLVSETRKDKQIKGKINLVNTGNPYRADYQVEWDELGLEYGFETFETEIELEEIYNSLLYKALQED